MKRKLQRIITLHVWFLILSFQLSAQTSGINLEGVFGSYKWINEVVITPCDIYGVPDSTKQAVTSIAGQRFRVINTAARGYVIKIDDYVNNTNNVGYIATYNLNDVSQRSFDKATRTATQKYFLITGEMLLAGASKIEREKGTLVAGVISLPFKFRLQDGDFNGNFNIGAAGGWRFDHFRTKTAFSLLGAASVSTINLDTASVSKSDNEILGTNTLSAITLSIGGMVELGKVQAGLFIGFDWLSRLNNQKFGWKYQGKPWFSFGIGYTIFGTEKKAADKETQNPGDAP